MSNDKSNETSESCPPSRPVSFTDNRRQRQQLGRLEEVFHAMSEDKELAKEFSEEPLEVMKRFNVNTTNLKINKSKFGVPMASINQGGLFSDRLSLTVCASIGYIVCATVGDEF